MAFYSHSLDKGYDFASFGIGLARVCYGFPLGVLLYKFRHSMPSFPKIPAAAVLIVFLFVLMLPRAANLAADVVAIPLIVIVAIGIERPEKRPLLSWLGSTSYAIYAIHSPIIVAGNSVARIFGGNGIWTDILIVCTVVAVAHILHHYVDEPLRRFAGPRLKHIASLASKPFQSHLDRKQS